jgi:hypothetical protein
MAEAEQQMRAPDGCKLIEGLDSTRVAKTWQIRESSACVGPEGEQCKCAYLAKVL